MRRTLNHLVKPVALLVIAAQLLFGLPAMAAAQAPAATGTHAPCDEMPHHQGCPCCPDDGGSMKDCLATCSLAAGITPSVSVVAVMPSHAAPFVEYSDYLTSLSDPPLKPPPIV